MTFLDSSVIIDMLAGVDATVEYVQRQPEPYLTSSLCVFEVLNGKLGSGSTDVRAARRDFDGVHAIDLTEDVAIEAAALQDALLDDGQRMAARDLLIAATAKSTGDELVVADGDFETTVLQSHLDVTNLASGDCS
ncbi:MULTISPECIES: PIN domain-containing protein [Halobacterium]|uniref:PIN domain-containing protein n=1 Tax=Halobacterium TaxID=2239 RepID=UPI00073F0AE4|nr:MULTISPECIES: PIN domain-containing protein [Halobacterium]MCG1004480.1 PIN domain-containing protein [Halobacterium noricense]